MNRVLEILITAKDEASKELQGLQGAMKEAEGASQAFALGLAGVATAVGFCIKEFQDSEIQTTKLTKLMKNTTNATDEQVKSLLDQASAIQKVGVVSDDTIVALDAQLATFELSTDTIKMMTPAILDMVVAEKGVNTTTEDMISFGNAFGMAMEGNYASLTKRGFKLDENTKYIIENGTETEKATAITKYLSDTYGGLNAEMGNLSAGGMAKLKNQMGSLMEDIGGAFNPVLEALVKNLNNLLTAITPLIQQLPDFFKWLSENQQVMIAIAGVILGALVPAIWGAVTAVGAMAVALAPFIIGGLIVAGFINGIIQIKDNWQGAWNTMQLTVGTIGIRIKTIINDIKLSIMGLMNALSSGISGVWEGIMGIFKGGINSVLKMVNFLIEQLNKIQVSIPAWVPAVGGKSFGINIPQVPYLAKGGVVTGPTLAMVGEKGPEAIIPLNKAGGMTGIVVNINGGTYLSEDVAEEIGDSIINRLKTQLAI